MTPPAPTPEQPKRGADVRDACRHRTLNLIDPDETCYFCLNPRGRHAAARVAEDERRAL